MTQTTDKRQLRITIEGILKSYGVDNLALEAKLTDGVMMYFEQTAKPGANPVSVRNDILGAMINFALDSQKHQAMQERVERALKVTPDGSDNWNEIIRWLLKKQDDGETIEAYGDWCKSDPYNSPKAHQIGQKPSLIKITWKGAFIATEQPARPEYQPAKVIEQVATPNPFKKPASLRG